MIQGIDGSALINAFRAGRNDRMEADAFKSKQDAAARDAKRQEEVRGVMGQLFGGKAPTTGGVAGQLGVSTGTEAAPAMVEAPAMAQEPPSRAAYDPELLQKLVMLDPDTGNKVASAFKAMDEMTLKRQQAKNDMLGLAAHVLAKVPPAQRQQQMTILAPQLKAAGWTDQELAAANLTDEGLRAYQGTAIDFDKMIDNELAEREFMAGKTVAMQPGGGVANIRPTFGPSGEFMGNTAQVVIQPNTGDAQTGASASGVQEGATATNPKTGEKIQFKGGQWVPMGGGGSNATGGFRP